MTKKKNLYFYTEKNIYDALHHKRLTSSLLHSMLLKRGIIIPSDLDKEVLIEEICRLPHCYEDLQKIKDLVQTYDKRESTTNAQLNIGITQLELKNVTESIKKMYASESESLNINTKADGSISIELNYQDIDLSRTELRQIDNRTINMDFNISSNKINVRMPSNNKAKELLSVIEEKISSYMNVVVERVEISLEAVTNPSLRSKFFNELLANINGYKLVDVTNIELNKIKSHDDEDENEENINTSFVKRAVLKGEAVNTSSIFSQLHAKGYYISKISWAAVPVKNNGDQILLDASFKNIDTCSDFSYQIRGVNNYKGGKYNITSRPASEPEKKTISLLIEESAEKAYNLILSEISCEDEECEES